MSERSLVTSLIGAITGRAHRVAGATTRRRFAAEVARSAARQRATVDLTVARDVRIGRGVRVSVAEGSASSLVLDDGVSIGDGCEIRLEGGKLHVGPWSDVRARVALVVAGDLEIAGHAVVSWGSVIHCHREVRLDEGVGLGEYTTVVDSAHYATDDGTPLWDNVAAGRVHIGRHSFVGAKATVTRNVVIGERCVVAANSLVVDDIPDAHFARGVPARNEPLPARRQRAQADRSTSSS